jgi:dihydroorotate dehydrogenase
MYALIRSVLFWFDAEKVHHFAMNSLRFVCRIPFGRKIIQSVYQTKSKPVPLLGLKFPNVVGLAAGFDKNALYLNELSALGFGFVEIGTVTPLPQDGNEKPRLFRLPQDKALINRMGFNNHGANAIAERLKAWQANTKKSSLIIGGNIGKNKNTPNELAWQDYEKCFLALHDHVDYFVVNVSSPNTPGLRQLQEKDALQKILTHLQQLNRQRTIQRPLLLKIAPDLTTDQVNDVIALAIEINLDGLVVSNTTIDRSNLQTPTSEVEKIGAGGLSGLPVKNKSTQLIQYIHQQTKGQLPIIGSGGIFTANDAREKMMAGSSLVQVWTGFVYEGPAIVKKIVRQA